MLITNTHSDYRRPLVAADAATLGPQAAAEATRVVAQRPDYAPTPLVHLPGLAARLGVGAIAVKDEGYRLGLGSFKALGGAYAVTRLALEGAGHALGRELDVADLARPEVRAVTGRMVFACATDGNHGRSVAQRAALVGARSVVFVHRGVSDLRVAAIARFGADMVRVDGSYDDSIVEAARVADTKGWTVVSDTSWEGYERIPGLIMQGYTVLLREALAQLADTPTHVFVQAGVGGIAAAAAGYLALTMGDRRPDFIVVDPARAACIFETARAGHPVRIAAGEPTVMAMLECHEPSPVAWRVLSRAADAFMTAEDADAVTAMNLLARPQEGDPAIVSGESGAAGLAGLIGLMREPDASAAIGIGRQSRVLLINTEGATDPQLYTKLVGLTPEQVRDGAA